MREGVGSCTRFTRCTETNFWLGGVLPERSVHPVHPVPPVQEGCTE